MLVLRKREMEREDGLRLRDIVLREILRGRNRIRYEDEEGV